MIEHPVLKFLGISLALELNDKHNEKMLREGRYITWWRRHLLLVICLAVLAPVILVGGFIIAVNVANPSAGTMEAFGTFLGWAIPIALLVGGIWAYARADRRWKRDANKPTTVVVRRD